MAAKNEAKIKFLAETSEFTEQIKKANQSMTELRSELKLSEEQFKGNENSVEALTAKKKILQQQLEASAQKVEALRQKLEKAKEIYGENSTEVSKLKTQLNNAERQYVQTENAIEDCNKDLDNNSDEAKEAEKALDNLSDSADKANDGFTVMKGVLADLAADGIRLLVDGLKEVSKYVLNTGMDFEYAMSEVKAISGASADDIEALTEKAKQMGAETKFSASESAEAFKFMAQAGWDTSKMLDGIEGVMSLAAAGGADLALSAEIVTDGLTAMGYSAGEAGRLADVMAMAANKSSTDVEQMGYTFKYAAPIAGTLGYSMEDLAIAMGLMANAGIKSETAGTSLRASMLRMTKPTKEMSTVMEEYGISITNSDGSMKSLMEVMEIYRDKLGGLSEAEKTKAAATLFGTEAASGMLGVINASPEAFAEMTDAIYNSEGAAKEMAETMQDNLKSDVEQLGGALETVGLQAYEGFSQPMRQAVQDVTETISSYDVAKLVNGISYEIGNLAQSLADRLPSAINGVVGFLQTLIDNIDAIAAGVKGFIATWAILKGLSITVSIGGVIAKVASLVSGLIAGTITIGGVTTALGGMSAAMAAATGGISLVVAGVAFLATKLLDGKSKSDEFSDSFLRSTNTLTEFQWGLNNLQPSLSGTTNLVSSFGNSMSTLEQKISTAEQNITQIMYDEQGKQKTLRDTDIQQIKDYYAEIQRLKLEQLEIQRQQQEIELLQLQRKLEKEGALTQEAAAQAIVDAKASYEQSAQATQEFYDSEYARIVAHHKQMGTYGSEAMQAELDALDAKNADEIKKNEAARDEILRIAASEASEWVKTDAQKWNDLANNADIGKKEYKQTMESMNMENAKAFMQMVSTAKSEGIELTDETEKIAKDMLDSFKNLPKDMEESGKSALEGIISGMENKIPGLEDTSEMTADEIVETLEKELQINSPSRVTQTIGGYVAEGLAVGMENKQGVLGSRITSFASGLISKIKSAFGVASPSKLTAEIGGYLSEGLGVGIEENEDAAIKPMQCIVDKVKGIDVAGEWGKLSGAGGSLNYDVSAQLGDYVANAIDSNSPYAILGSLINAVEDLASRAINLDIDGMRFATATAGATDNVSGSRLNLRNRGLAL